MKLSTRLRNSAFKTILRSPERVLRALGGRPDRKDGMLLDAHVGALLMGARIANIQDRPDVASSRKYMDQETQSVGPESIAMAIERDLWVGGRNADIRARVYTPKTAKPNAGLLVYFHGGGFVAGSITSHDLAVRELAHDTGCIVMSVDYALAPEQKFPAAIEDGFAAYKWARANAHELGADPTRVGVGGDSAGGNLSAVVTHLAKARSVAQPTVQLLLYPATDMTRALPSHKTFAKGYLLDEDRVKWYMDHYLENEDQERDPRASPLFYEHFDGLAPAIVVTAGFDVLRDEGEAYATKLRDAGIRVDYTCEEGLIHGFFNMSGAIPAAREANARMATALREYLA
jgi:acetyl esterase